MSTEIIITSLVAPIIPSIVAFILGRRKTKAEVDGKEIDNFKESILAYQAIISDLRIQISESIAQNKETRVYYKSQSDQLKRKIDILSKDIKDMKALYPCADCPRKNL